MHSGGTKPFDQRHYDESAGEAFFRLKGIDMPAKKQTYYEKLKDPRWQKKRLEVMQANDFCCECCTDSESPLNVHHKEYFKGLEPWEYEIEQLSCLCESCHELNHASLDVLKWVCSYAKLDGPENRTELAFLLAGYTMIPYEDLLSISCLDDSKWNKLAYDIGAKANSEFFYEIEKTWEKEVSNNG